MLNGLHKSEEFREREREREREMARVWVGLPTAALGRGEGDAVERQRMRLAVDKPVWIVRIQSSGGRRKAKGGCVVCEGTGKVDCHDCGGKGRNNRVNMEVLPRGEWPRWCRWCGGSGLAYCFRCLGTGEYRDVMGFRSINSPSRDS